MKIIDTYDWLSIQASNAAKEWWSLQSANPFAALYLYFRRGQLTVAEDKPAGFELGTGQRLSPMATLDGTTAWIYAQAFKLPCLPEE